jgi:hypothetical protein
MMDHATTHRDRILKDLGGSSLTKDGLKGGDPAGGQGKINGALLRSSTRAWRAHVWGKKPPTSIHKAADMSRREARAPGRPS